MSAPEFESFCLGTLQAIWQYDTSEPASFQSRDQPTTGVRRPAKPPPPSGCRLTGSRLFVGWSRSCETSQRCNCIAECLRHPCWKGCIRHNAVGQFGRISDFMIFEPRLESRIIKAVGIGLSKVKENGLEFWHQSVSDKLV